MDADQDVLNACQSLHNVSVWHLLFLSRLLLRLPCLAVPKVLQSIGDGGQAKRKESQNADDNETTTIRAPGVAFAHQTRKSAIIPFSLIAISLHPSRARGRSQCSPTAPEICRRMAIYASLCGLPLLLCPSS